MSSLSVYGLISGLNTTQLVNQLMQLEALPKQRLQVSLKAENSSVGAYQSIATRLKSVETSIAALAKDATWGARTATVTGSAVTATAAAGATTGQSTVQVTALATADTWTSDTHHGLDDLVVTTVPPEVSILNTKGEAVTVTPASGSLRDVIAAINDVPDSGLSAVAVKVGTDAYRLQIRATETGTASTAGYVSGLSMPVTALAGVDAEYTVDGIAGTSTSNTVTDLLPGVNVTFAQTGSSTVTVASEPTATSDAVKNLVDEVNKALDEIAKHTLAGANGTTRGALGGDAQARGIATNVLRAVSDALGGQFAAQAGIQTTKDGRLTFDAAVFTTAYEKDPAAVRSLVAPVDGVGIAQRLGAVVSAATNSTDGTITTSIQGRERTVKDLQNQIDGWDRRLESRREVLNRQFSGLEVALQRLQSQGGYLASALNSMTAQSR